MIRQPMCSRRDCVHFQGAQWLGDTESSERVVCSAYPKGIPSDIAYGDNLHEAVQPDQVGEYIYTPKGKRK